MRKLFISIALGLSLTLFGCMAGQYQMRDPATLVTVKQKIQYTIDTTNVAITSASRTITGDVKAGLMTKEIGREYYNKLVKISNLSDEAQHFLNIGKELDAQEKIDLANTLINLLEAELVKQVNKENK